jgi:hypothetical protein
MCERTSRALVAAAIVGFTVATPVSSRAQSLAQRRTVAIVVPAADQTQELRLRDGSRLYGRVVTIEADHISFRTVAGAEVRVARSEILWLAVAEGRLVKGEFLPADSNATRLFFGPTARSLRRGQAYVGVYELLLPTVQVGLTDRFSIGGGTLPLFGFEDGRLAWITPKVQLYSGDRAAVAAGVIHFFVSGEDDVGIAFAATTFGPSDAAVTTGAGCAYATGDEGGCSAVVMVGGERRLSRRVKFISENYLWKGSGLLSGGFRFLGDRLSADVGLVIPLGTDEFVAVPIVNFVWMF